MTQILFNSSRVLGVVVAVSATTNIAIGSGYTQVQSTEANAQITWRTPGTFSNLYCRLQSNGATANSTVRYRVGGANGNQVLTIGSGATGEFTDTLNSDTPAAGNRINYQIIAGSGTTQLVFSLFSSLFSPTTSSNTVNKLTCSGTATDTSVNTTYFNTIEGQLSTSGTGQTTEANAQYKNKTAATLQNLFINVSANTASVATVASRLNGGAGSLLASIGSGATGVFEDTTHSDTLASGDLINTALNSTVTTSLTLTTVAVDYLTTSGNTHYISGGFNLNSVNANTTTNIGLGGLSFTGTETFAKAKALIAFTASNLECFVQKNTVTATSTIKFRKNGANGNQVLSIGSSATGYFEDTLNNDVLISTDEINYQIITGATGTSILLNSVGILAAFGGSSPPATPTIFLSGWFGI